MWALCRDYLTAGLNLEDTDHTTGALVEVEEQAAYIAAVRAAASHAGVDLVINARTDPFVRGETQEAVTEAIHRGRRFLEAGADCSYPILAVSEDPITRLVGVCPDRSTSAAFPAAPGPRRLAELGVARISFGPLPYRAALEAFKAMATRTSTGDSPY